MPVQAVDGRRFDHGVDERRGLMHVQNPVDQARRRQRQDRVHVVPQTPLAQHAIGPAALSPAQLLAKTVQKRIEIVIVNDKQAAIRTAAIVLLQVLGNLQPHRRLAGAFFAEHNRRGRLVRVAVNLVPRRMKSARNTVLFEDPVRLRILLGKRIPRDPMMFQKLLNSHVLVLVE